LGFKSFVNLYKEPIRFHFSWSDGLFITTNGNCIWSL
jgi:hypothetical protein